MADLNITEIRPTSTTKTRRVQLGATCAVGTPVLYLDTSDNKYKLADADSTAAVAGGSGLVIAISFGDDGEYAEVAYGGMLVLVCSPVIAEGLVYVVSNTAGKAAPAGDLASTWNCSILGVGAASNEIDLTPLYASGQTVA